MKILIQNLQKQSGLAMEMMQTYQPDVMLLQEINIRSENAGKNVTETHNTSRLGYGTAIYAYNNGGANEHQHHPYKISLVDSHRVDAPFPEFGGFIHKKTTIATALFKAAEYDNNNNDNDNGADGTSIRVELVSFHGYNGQPFKSVPKLVAHVDAVLSVLRPEGPAVFAGDFNTWTTTTTDGHLAAVKQRMEHHGFHLAYSWPYPHKGRKNSSENDELKLDHVFLRNVQLDDSLCFSSISDHLGALIDVSFHPTNDLVPMKRPHLN